MLSRVDSASQNQVSDKSTSWLHATAPLKSEDLRPLGLQAYDASPTRVSDAKVPRSPTIQAKWPSFKGRSAPKARISGEAGTGHSLAPSSNVQLAAAAFHEAVKDRAATERVGKATASESLKAPEQPLIALEGDAAVDVLAVFEAPLAVPAQQHASSKPLTRTDSSDSISKILYDTPDNSPRAPPSELTGHESGNPFVQHSDLLPPAPPTAFRPPLQSHASMPLRSELNRLPSVGESGLLRAMHSTELPTHRSLGGGELSNGWSAPLPPSWFPVESTEPQRHSRTLSDGHGILGRSWSAAAANIDPCAEVLVTTFADFSKDIIPAQASRTPMNRQASLSSQRSMQSTH